MDAGRVIVLFASILILSGFAAAGFEDTERGGYAVSGDADVTAVANPTIVDRVVSGLKNVIGSPLTFFEEDPASTVEQGGTLNVQVGDVTDQQCDDTVFIVEAYAPEPPSDRDYDVRDLDHLTEYDPIASGTLISADTSLNIPVDATTGEWTLVSYVYCYTTNNMISVPAETTFDVTSADTDSTGDTITASPDVQEYKAPQVSAAPSSVESTFFLTNTGGDMSEQWAIEMQVQPKGSGLMSFVDNAEELCDPDHPENVHKDFRISPGDRVKVSLSTSEVEQGQEYDVWAVSGTACANEGGSPAGPYANPQKVATVCVGDCESGGGLPVTVLLLAAGAGLLVLGGVAISVRN